ncbi:hypothetical protein G3N18_01990 [Microbacterium sp. 2C]|uniref:hypothetical protein n=1 Tax=Microbacterium paulum TaxID=2707006 RepID=UPI0018C28ADA|nr:hypothetical protein [Microbacterium paulum]MBG0716858.1 hypothetical protein [Microbacterium paulum]
MGASTVKTIRRIIHDESGDLDDLPGWTILALAAVTLFGLIIWVGRGGAAANTVQAAAYAAARDASISRTVADAVPHAQAAATTALGGNVTCIDLDVKIGGDGLSTGIGQTGTVTATVSCTIATSDISFPGMPGSVTITKTASSPVDPYRER